MAATAACEEVKKSKKFAKILELILLIGNIMNAGTKNAQSVGFDISYLPKVRFDENIFPFKSIKTVCSIFWRNGLIILNVLN